MLDLRDFEQHKNLFSFEKKENGKVRVSKKRFDENGKEAEPFVLETNLIEFDNIILDNKQNILTERRSINATKAQIAAKEAELDERENQLETGAVALRKEIDKVLNSSGGE